MFMGNGFSVVWHVLMNVSATDEDEKSPAKDILGGAFLVIIAWRSCSWRACLP